MADWIHRINGQDAHKNFWGQHRIEISSCVNKNKFCYDVKTSARYGHST